MVAHREETLKLRRSKRKFGYKVVSATDGPLYSNTHGNGKSIKYLPGTVHRLNPRIPAITVPYPRSTEDGFYFFLKYEDAEKYLSSFQMEKIVKIEFNPRDVIASDGSFACANRIKILKVVKSTKELANKVTELHKSKTQEVKNDVL